MRAPGFLILSLVLAACSSSKDATTTSSSSSGTGGSGTGGGAGGAPVIGGDRPVTVYVPSGYKPGVPAPLLDPAPRLLGERHGRGALPPARAVRRQERLPLRAPERHHRQEGRLLLERDGRVLQLRRLDGRRQRVPARRSSSRSRRHYSVDPKRVYLVGHSNGGFMSYRMACDHADRDRRHRQPRGRDVRRT